jgi:glucose/mannose-6-phosphate isomerase
MSKPLDDPALYTRLDPSGMDGHIAGLPKQAANAWREALAFKLPTAYRKAERIVVAGMGGSAVGGELASDFCKAAGRPSITVHRDYGTPPDIDRKTLVIAASYSGNTEECLSAFKAALAKGAMGIAATRGGKLARLCKARGLPVFTIGYDSQPRAALGYGVMPMLAMAQNLGLAKRLDAQVKAALSAMDNLAKRLHPSVPTEQNPAKQMAERIGERVAVIIGAEHLIGAARRWKSQIQENAKSWAFHDALPEFDHNSIEGVALPRGAAAHTIAIFLSSATFRPQTKRRIEVTNELLRRSGLETATAEAGGKGPLANILTSVLFGDYVSYYLAMLRGADPTPVPNLSWIKERLSQR